MEASGGALRDNPRLKVGNFDSMLAHSIEERS